MVIFIRRYFFIISIFNSLYLSFVNLKGFLFEQNLAQLEKAFTVTIFSTPVILVVIINLHLFKKINFVNLQSSRILLPLSLITVSVIFGIFIYSALKDNYPRFLLQFIIILFEIFSIYFAIQKTKENKLTDLIIYFSLCFFTGIISYVVIGILEDHFLLEKINNKLIFIYTAVFFHLFNACYIFYKSFLEKLQI